MAEERPSTSKETIALGVLLVVLLASALAVIYAKNYSRSLFIEIEQQERALEQYDMDWSRRQLELSRLAEQNRVESIAKDKLKLVMPPKEKTIYLKP